MRHDGSQGPDRRVSVVLYHPAVFLQARALVSALKQESSFNISTFEIRILEPPKRVLGVNLLHIYFAMIVLGNDIICPLEMRYGHK